MRRVLTFFAAVLLFFGGSLLRGDEQAPVTVSLIASRSGVRPGGTIELAVIVDVRPGYHIIKEGAALRGLGITFLSDGPVAISSPVFPGGERLQLDFFEEPVEVYSGRQIVRAEAMVDPGTPPGTVDIAAKVNYQACAEAVCFPPREETVTIRVPVVPEGSAIDELNQEIFGIALRDEEGGRSYLGWLITAFFWGIGACLTPCIYPMIAITVGFFGGQVRGRSRSILFLAIAYVIGIAVTYSALGVTAALSGRILGSALQNPAVVIAFSALLAILSLSMFGLYELRAPSVLMRVAGGKTGLLGAFIMGLLVAVLGLPCIGPLTIGLMVYVQKIARADAGFLIFLSFSLGLGTPFIFLALFSGSLERLPRSGVWLLWVRKILGFVLLWLAVYYLSPLLPERVEEYLFGLLCLAAAVTLYLSGRRGESGRVFPIVRGATAAAALALSVYMLLPSEAVEGPEWMPYGEAALAEAVSNDRPAVILFTAEWCPPCQKMKKSTFRATEVIEALKDVVPLKADLTSKPSPDVKAAVGKYGIKGVPTIIFIDSAGSERRALRSVGLVGPAEIVSKLRSLEQVKTAD